ncbi:hypothetical protein CRG98_043001 [Punica granatum]|uniref:Uncharacterized protein n=1 Tax=Punica granatum TaxID=22663 RepID=A0A2I0HY11_PUNGR|nr:hypothetical protein CRG98_043001 [Punica granatum]
MDEVEQLLQAAHDDVLMKLSLNSHIARFASQYLNPDLSHRFQALKSPPSAPSFWQPKPSPLSPQVNDELKTILGDDLSAQFAALRGSPHPSSSSSFSPSMASTNMNEEDEVEKIIQWAKDAARLDTSPPFDEEPCDNDDDKDSNLEIAQ